MTHRSVTALALYRLWYRTQRLRGRISVCEHIRPQGRPRQHLPYRTALSCCLRKRSKHQAIATRGLSQRFTCIVTPLVSHIQRSTSASRLSRTLSTWSHTPVFTCIEPFRHAVCSFCFPMVAKKQTSCPHCHRVTPTVLLFLSVSTPLRGFKGCPSGSYYYSRPPPTRGRWPVGRPRLPPSPGFATLRSVVRG